MEIYTKHMRLWVGLLLATLGLSSIQLFGQGFTAAVSKNRVAVGEAFQIEFTISEAGADNFKPPVTLKDFDVYSGPNHSSSVQIINGNMSQSTTISYVLVPKKEGKITIAPATITVGGKLKQSNPIALEVLKNGNGSGPAASAGNSQGNGQGNAASASNPAEDHLFARVIVNRSKVYLGEQITVIHKIYSKLSLKGFQDIKFPSYNGFWTQDVPQKGQFTITTENFDGVNYNVVELKRSYIFPQRSGNLEIEPMEVACVVRQRSNNRQPQSIFDQFFGNGGYEDVLVKVKSKPIKVEVIPLPEQGKPADFSGAVGNYTFKASLNKSKVKTNEAVNLNITITGAGNIKLIDPVKVKIPDDIETYDPKINDNISITNAGITGTKSIEYLLIPRHGGEFKIDQVSFSYFNPDKKAYVTLPSPEFNLSVEKGKDDDNATTIKNSASDQKEVVMLGNDIRYIKNHIELTKASNDNGFYGSFGFFAGIFCPILLLGGVVFMKQRYAKNNLDGIVSRSKNANKVANRRLTVAKKFLDNQQKEPFYEEIFKALNGYLSDRLSIPYAQLNKENVTESLKKRMVKEEVCQQLNSVLNNCEFARYAPSSVSSDLMTTYQEAQNIITQIEGQIKSLS